MCQSFSYDEKTEECLLSQSTFAFNPGWVYYSKEKGGCSPCHQLALLTEVLFAQPGPTRKRWCIAPSLV